MNPRVPQHQLDRIPAGYDGSATLRALLLKVNDPTSPWTASDIAALNSAINEIVRRDESRHTATDAMGNNLCSPIFYRLTKLVELMAEKYLSALDNYERSQRAGEMVEAPAQPKVRRQRDDRFGRGVIVFEDNATTSKVGDVLHIKQPTKAQKKANQKHYHLVAANFRAHYNGVTKEKVEVRTDVPGYAMTIAHTDLASGGNPKFLSFSSNGVQGKKVRSEMNRKDLAKLREFYNRV